MKPITRTLEDRSTIGRAMSLRALLGPILAIVCLGTLLTGCGDKLAKDAHANAPADKAASKLDPMLVSVDTDFAGKIRVAPVATSAVADSLRIAGRLELNAYRTARIGTPVTGRITQIDVIVGQPVKAGQTLAELSSSEMTTAQLSYMRAHAQQQLMSRAVERAQLLVSADVIGSAELQRRENELTIATAEKRAASDQLRLLGLSQPRIARLEKSGQIQPTGAISATSSGVLIERNLGVGQIVNPTDSLFVISDLSSVWAVAEVPEQDAQFVRPGQVVEVEIPALDNRTVKGTVTLVGDVVNADTRSVRVTVELDNPERTLKPSMLITMLIQGRIASRPVIPGSAVVRDDDHDYVFVQVGEHRFKLTPVSVSVERDGRRALLKPLPDDAQLVVDGAYHLNNLRELRNTTR